jgi:hypothetical protein
VVVLLVTVYLCVVTFGPEWLLASLLRLDHARQALLIFCLGMNKNGARVAERLYSELAAVAQIGRKKGAVVITLSAQATLEDPPQQSASRRRRHKVATSANLYTH